MPPEKNITHDCESDRIERTVSGSAAFFSSRDYFRRLRINRSYKCVKQVLLMRTTFIKRDCSLKKKKEKERFSSKNKPILKKKRGGGG